MRPPVLDASYSPALIFPAVISRATQPLLVHRPSTSRLDPGLRRALEKFELEFGLWLMVTSEQKRYWRRTATGKRPRVELILQETERLYVWGQGLKARVLEFEEAKLSHRIAQQEAAGRDTAYQKYIWEQL